MGMTKKLWSINALATEFDHDRRTVALRIDGIKPAGKLGRSPAWRLADVAPVLSRQESSLVPAAPPVAAEPPPPGAGILARLTSDFDVGAMAMVLPIAYAAPARLAALATHHGLSARQAFQFWKAAQMALVGQIEATASELQVFGSEAPKWLELDHIVQPDWESICKRLAEPFEASAFTLPSTPP